MTYELILKAARSQNQAELDNILKNHSIDEWKVGGYRWTAGAQLASEYNQEACAFLMANGAGINYIARGAAAGGHLHYAESLRKFGASVHFVAEGAALGGFIDYSEEMRARGADPRIIAFGASLGGHMSYAVNLQVVGVKINDIVEAAAAGGHFEYVEKLKEFDVFSSDFAEGAAAGGHIECAEKARKRGADKDSIARGAATGGHLDYAERLRQLGANVDELSIYTALSGHFDYANKLHEEGASVENIAEGTGLGNHIVFAERLMGLTDDAEKFVAIGASDGRHITRSEVNQMFYLSQYQPALIPRLVGAFSLLGSPRLRITYETEHKAIEIATIQKQDKLSHAAAVLKVDPESALALHLWVLVSLGLNSTKFNPSRYLLTDLWRIVLDYALPIKLTKSDMERLGFVLARQTLSQQLSDYSQVKKNPHSDRAKNLNQVVEKTENKEQLLSLMSKQQQIIEKKNPYSFFDKLKPLCRDISNQKDQFTDLIKDWSVEESFCSCASAGRCTCRAGKP